MRILFFIDSYVAGGKERRLTELMKMLKQHPGIEFELVVMSQEIHYKEVFDLGIRIHYMIRKTRKDPGIFSRVYSLCREYKPGIVHCWDSMTAVYLVPACLLLRIPLVNGMVTDTPVDRSIKNKHWLRGKLTFPFSSLIVGNSLAGLKGYGAPARKSSCIYNGIDLRRFNNLQENDKIRKEYFGEESSSLLIVGMVAAFEERKDYRTVIEAAINLVNLNPDIRFMLVGGGSMLKDTRAKIPQELESKVICTGKKNNVESIIQLFDIGLLITNAMVHGEGISNSIIEYMALSKPVIATRGGGTDELVIDGYNGHLIAPGDSNELARIIVELLSDEKKRAEMGARGRQMILEKFSLEMMTEKYILEYQKLTN